MYSRILALTAGARRRRVARTASWFVVITGLGTVFTLSVWLWQLKTHSQGASDLPVGPEPGGTLLICGGGKLPEELRRRFYDRAGGQEARLVVIPGIYVGDDDELSE